MKAETMVARWKRVASIIISDLSLLASLTLAHLIIWRTLRTRRRERAERLKSLKLVNGSGQASSGNELPVAVGLDEKEMLGEVSPRRRFGRRW